MNSGHDHQPLRLRPDIRFRKIANEGVVLRQDEGEVLVVNGVGVHIVELVQKGASRDEIHRELIEAYDVDPEQLKRDIAAYLEELQQAGVFE